MIRRILAVVLIVLGLATAGVGAALGTIWRADETVTATLPQQPEVPVVVAGGNVLATVNSEVTVTVTGQEPDTDLVIAMGRESDVRAWLGDASYLEVTGLSDWDTLAVEKPAETSSETSSEQPSENASQEPTEQSSEEPSGQESQESADQGSQESAVENPVPNPAGSDLWIEQVTGKGELTYDWNQVEGRWMMLVASDGSHPAPTVSMTWERNVATPLVLPLIIAGAVVFLIGLVWLIIELLVLREERRARRAALESGDETGEAPVVATTDADGNPLTRRQIREASRTAAVRGSAGAAASAPSGRSGPSGPSPQSGPSASSAPSGRSPEEGDSAESSESGESVSGAEDLAAWVSSTGPAAQDHPDADRNEAHWQGAEPTGTAAPANNDEPDNGEPGHDEPDNDEPDNDEPDNDEPDNDEPGHEGSGEESRAQGSGLRHRWRRRRRKDRPQVEPASEVDTGDAPMTEQLQLGTPPPDSSGTAEPGRADSGSGPPSPSETESESGSNPQASGASWRATWGLGPVDERTDDQEEDR